MWFFILLILIGAYFQTVLRLTLINRLYRIIIISSLVTITMLFYKYATLYNLKDLNIFLQNKNTLATICIIVVAQEIITLIFGAILLRKKFMKQKYKFYDCIALMPSGIFPIGQFLLLIYIFNKYSGINYFYSNLITAVSIVILSIILSEFFRCFSFENKIKINVMSSFAMISTAMFLPIILNSSIPKTNYISIDINMLYGLMTVVIGIVIFALLSPFIKNIKTKLIKIILK